MVLFGTEALMWVKIGKCEIDLFGTKGLASFTMISDIDINQ